MNVFVKLSDQGIIQYKGMIELECRFFDSFWANELFEGIDQEIDTLRRNLGALE